MKAKEIAIKGKVHDVGYRLFLLSLQNRINYAPGASVESVEVKDYG
jgi:hypothetical protein